MPRRTGSRTPVATPSRQSRAGGAGSKKSAGDGNSTGKRQGTAARGTRSQSASPSESAVNGGAESNDRRQAAAGQYLTFFFGAEEYALSILDVREIVEYTNPTPIPMTPPWILGVINLRGNVVPVMSLTRKFSLPTAPAPSRTCVVIVEVHIDGELTAVGTVAEAIGHVVDLGADDIEPPPAFGARIGLDCLLGMAKQEDRLIPILDLRVALDTEELSSMALELTPPAPDDEVAAGDGDSGGDPGQRTEAGG